MNSINISQKAKNKHLNFSHYEFIINSLIQFNASHPGKRNTGKTQFIKELASTVGTTVSNIYSIIKDATISVRDYNLKVHYELSAMAAFEKRSKNHKIPNNSKFEKSKEFISLVEQEVKSNRLSSIDETINYLKLHQPDIIKNMVIVSTKTFYSMSTREEHPSSLSIFLAWSEERQKRTGSHTFQKTERHFHYRKTRIYEG